jgi:hypothetical protein
MNRLRIVLFTLAICVAPIASAQVVGDITFTITPTGGTPTTYTIDKTSAWNIFWQLTQGLRNAETTQLREQYARPGCLVDPNTAPDGQTTFNWATDKIWDQAGAYYSIAPGGIPYRNGVRLGTVTTVQRLCQFGGEIFAKGKTDAKWYRWATPAADSWNALPTASLDPTVFN